MVSNSDVTHKLYHFWRTGPEILHGATFRPYKRPRAYKLGSLNQNLNRRQLISSRARFFGKKFEKNWKINFDFFLKKRILKK